MIITLYTYCCGKGAGSLYKMAGQLMSMGIEVDINIRHYSIIHKEIYKQYGMTEELLKTTPMIVFNNKCFKADEWQKNLI